VAENIEWPGSAGQHRTGHNIRDDIQTHVFASGANPKIASYNVSAVKIYM
jgi:hypothetical protein